MAVSKKINGITIIYPREDKTKEKKIIHFKEGKIEKETIIRPTEGKKTTRSNGKKAPKKPSPNRGKGGR